PRVQRTQVQGGTQSFVGVGGRHAHVGDEHVGQRLGRAERRDDLVGRAVAGDGVSFGGQESRESVKEEDGVLGDHDAHGTSTVSRVPAPVRLTRSNEPSSASTRARSPSRPLPGEIVAPPSPSSAISRRNRSLATATCTVTLVALACFATFVSASAATK